MVVCFSLLPFHLQENITQKMAFIDFQQFQLSSNYSCNSFRQVRTTLDVHNMSIAQAEKCLPMEHLGVHLDFKAVTNWTNLPRFAVSEVFTGGATDESVEFFVELVNVGHIIPKKKTRLNWTGITDIGIETFRQLLEVFNVKEFSQSGEFDLKFCQLPEFSKLENVSFTSYVFPEVFLSLKSPSISFIQLNSSLESSLNQFFHQWFSNKRCITNLVLPHCQAEPIDNKTLLDKLPYTLIWRESIHSSSIISEIPLRALESGFKHRKYFLIERNEVKLLVTLDLFEVRAKEVVDVKQAVLHSLPYNIYCQQSL